MEQENKNRKLKIEDLSRKLPYKVDEECFDKLPQQIMAKVTANKAAKPAFVWLDSLKYAVPALLILLLTVFFLNQRNTDKISITENSLASINSQDAMIYLTDYELINQEDIMEISTTENLNFKGDFFMPGSTITHEDLPADLNDELEEYFNGIKLKTDMKKLYILLIFVMIGGSALAQDQQKKQKIDNARIALITSRIDLTSEQAQQFWPVYNEYTDKRQELKMTKRKLRMESFGADATDEKITADLRKFVDLSQKETDLEKEYLDKFLKVLKPKQVVQLYRAEREFVKMLLEKIE